MKKIIFGFIFFITFITVNCYADNIIIPFSCFPKQIQEKFLKHNVKLELNGEIRQKDTFGFIKNNGNSYEIVTYKPVTNEELEMIKNIIFEDLK